MLRSTTMVDAFPYVRYVYQACLLLLCVLFKPRPHGEKEQGMVGSIRFLLASTQKRARSILGAQLCWLRCSATAK